MPSADADSLARIRDLASNPTRVALSRQALSDLLAWNLTKTHLCEVITSWIDASKP